MSNLIDRQAAITIPVMPIEHRKYQTFNLDDAYEQGWIDCQDCIKELPSAEPERKKRKWIYGEKSGQDGWYCSECGGFIPWYYDFYGLDSIDFIENFKTCPFCDSKMVSYTGVDMRGEHDDER